MSTQSAVSKQQATLLVREELFFQTPYVAAKRPSSSSHSPRLSLIMMSLVCKSLRPTKLQPRDQMLVCVLGIFWLDLTDPGEVCMPCFDVEVKKIEHNSMGKISKAAVVDNQTLACIDHLCWR